MDKAKAKKAVKKSTSRKKQSKAPARPAEMGLPMQPGMGMINPEIQAAQPTLQPADGHINPYRELGSMAPMTYAPGNMLAGYNAPVMVHP